MRRIRGRLACSALAAILIVWPALSYPAVPEEDSHRSTPLETSAQTPATQGGAPAERLREGSVLKNVPGTFQAAGERIVFCPSDREAALPVLENLALERVLGLLETVGGRMWSVSGMVTEYRGRNYLLIDRAVVRSQAAKSAARP